MRVASLSRRQLQTNTYSYDLSSQRYSNAGVHVNFAAQFSHGARPVSAADSAAALANSADIDVDDVCERARAGISGNRRVSLLSRTRAVRPSETRRGGDRSRGRSPVTR